jgi:tetratricopeptide (TPR) repeat protein
MTPPDSTILTVIGTSIGLIAALIGLISAIVKYKTDRRRPPEAILAPPEELSAKSLLPTRARFVNRETELEDAIGRIRSGEMVLAIEGDVGIGKSAVATELAYRLTETEDGPLDLSEHTFLWFDCENRCPDLVAICGSLARLTRDQSLSTVADDEKLDALRVHLARHETVLLLDNLRLDDGPESDALRAFLKAVPAGSLVITAINRPGALQASRLPLPELDVEHIQELAELEARRLGLDCAEALDETFAQRLRDAVGGNPGMIEWFLESLRLSSRTLEQHLAAVELGDTLSDLHAPIWASLSGRAQLVLSACACLDGQAIGEQLEVGCELPETDVSAAVDELIGAGCVKTVRITGEPILYTCSRALRQFAIVATPDERLDSIARRLGRHLVERLRADPENALAVIPQVAAIRAILDELALREHDEDLQALFRAGLDVFYTLGLFDDRLAAGRLAYGSAERVGNHRGASLASEVLASTHALRGELDRAREALAHGVLAAERSGDPSEEARQKGCAGFVHYRSGNPRLALETIEGAEELARQAGNLETAVNVLAVQIAALWFEGEVEDAATAARQCLQVCEEMGWERPVAYPLRYLAEAAMHRRDIDEARRLLHRAHEIAAAFDDKRGLARISLSEARVELAAGHVRDAAQAARRARSEASALGLPPEAREARSVEKAARRAILFPPLRLRYIRRPPHRFTDAPVGGG